MIRKIKQLFVIVGLLTIAPLSNATIIEFDVSAYTHSLAWEVGKSTGIILEAGDFLSISADEDDLWGAGALPRLSNANGLDRNIFATATDDSGQPVGTLIGVDFGDLTRRGITAPAGSLVGSIDSNFFFIGTSYTSTAIATGELKLWNFDSNVHDNFGIITVSVETRHASQPNILGLMSIGFILIAMRRWKNR